VRRQIQLDAPLISTPEGWGVDGIKRAPTCGYPNAEKEGKQHDNTKA
jgi:hypothetical protein